MLRTYDPKKVAVIVGGIVMSGFAEDTYVKAERSEDAFTKKVGVDGEVSRSRQHNKSGELTISLMQSSPSNAVLSGFALLDETKGAGVVPVLVQDFSGTSIYISTKAWIRKHPAAEFGKEVGNREWVFDCDVLDPFTGGIVEN